MTGKIGGHPWGLAYQRQSEREKWTLRRLRKLGYYCGPRGNSGTWGILERRWDFKSDPPAGFVVETIEALEKIATKMEDPAFAKEWWDQIKADGQAYSFH